MEIVEEEEEDDAMVRWAVNTSLWRPTDQEFHSCLALLPPPEWPSVQRFVFSQTLLIMKHLLKFSWWLFLQQFFFHNRVILFNWELVVLHSSPRMFGEFSVHAWKCGVSNEEHTISLHWGSNSSFWHAQWTSRIGLLYFIRIPTLPLSMHHHNWKEVIDVVCIL